MQYRSIEEIFEAFKGLKVLIVGDAMVDAYIHGEVTRISPEAPVPIVNVKKRERLLGGAANVALNVKALGAEAILCSLVGEDLAAHDFEELLERSKLTSHGILKSKNRSTTVKNRVISGGHQLLRIDDERDQELETEDEEKFIACIQNLIKECDVVLIEDYNKGCLNPRVINETIRIANEARIPITVDPKERNFLSYKGATLFKPNLKELKEGLRHDGNVQELGSIEKAVAKLNDHLHCDNYLITLSEDGVYFQDRNENDHLAAHVRSIADVSGAGDTVISIASLGVALGLPGRIWAELANLGGGIVCETSGVIPIKSSQLLAEARNNTIINDCIKEQFS